MGIYRVYLRDFQSHVFEETKTNTISAASAAQAFAELVNRTDLYGQNVAAVLSYDNRHLAFHRYDRLPGQKDYWRGRLEEIEWPERPVAHGGAREGAGRPAQTTDGGPLHRKTVNLDEATIRALTEFGDRELSEGIRRAALLVEKMKSSSVSS